MYLHHTSATCFFSTHPRGDRLRCGIRKKQHIHVYTSKWKLIYIHLGNTTYCILILDYWELVSLMEINLFLYWVYIRVTKAFKKMFIKHPTAATRGYESWRLKKKVCTVTWVVKTCCLLVLRGQWWFSYLWLSGHFPGVGFLERYQNKLWLLIKNEGCGRTQRFIKWSPHMICVLGFELVSEQFPILGFSFPQ